MTNKLVEFLEKRRGEKSIRQLAKELEISHSYVADIIKYRKSITWSFAATVAERTGLEPMTAFQMAGLLPAGPKEK